VKHNKKLEAWQEKIVGSPRGLEKRDVGGYDCAGGRSPAAERSKPLLKEFLVGVLASLATRILEAIVARWRKNRR